MRLGLSLRRSHSPPLISFFLFLCVSAPKRQSHRDTHTSGTEGQGQGQRRGTEDRERRGTKKTDPILEIAHLCPSAERRIMMTSKLVIYFQFKGHPSHHPSPSSPPHSQKTAHSVKPRKTSPENRPG